MNRDALLVYLRDLRDLELAKLRLLTAPDGKAASSLLQNAYDLNLVPASYRNLASIYYIYDSLSASPISMEDVLHPEQMAQHIPYILKKLHHTITEEHSALLHTRCQEAHQPEYIAHTTQLSLIWNRRLVRSGSVCNMPKSMRSTKKQPPFLLDSCDIIG